METKRAWKKPMLRVVARAQSEERVLTGCKNDTGGQGYSNTDHGCEYTDTGGCQDCAHHTLS